MGIRGGGAGCRAGLHQPRSSTGCSRSPPACPARWSWWSGAGRPTSRRKRLEWVTDPTRCSAAECRSTGTWTTRPSSGCCCPTTPTSTGSTPSGPAARDPGRRDHAPAGQSASAGAVGGAADARVAGSAAVAGQGDGDRPGRTGSGGALLRLRRRRQAGLLRQFDDPRSAPKTRSVATVLDAGDPVDLHRITADLVARGVGRLMVEGGRTMHTQFLTAGLADELHLVVAPFFVGDSRAPRFVGDGMFPWKRRPPGRPGRGAADRRRGTPALRPLGSLRWWLSCRRRSALR